MEKSDNPNKTVTFIMPHQTIREVAEAIARKNGCDGPVHFIDDKWGGYFQTSSKYGPYNFRV